MFFSIFISRSTDGRWLGMGKKPIYLHATLLYVHIQRTIARKYLLKYQFRCCTVESIHSWFQKLFYFISPVLCVCILPLFYVSPFFVSHSLSSYFVSISLSPFLFPHASTYCSLSSILCLLFSIHPSLSFFLCLSLSVSIFRSLYLCLTISVSFSMFPF